MNKEELQEKKYLEDIKKKIKKSLADINQRLERHEKEIKEEVNYLQESRYDMDHAEKISARQSVDYAVTFAAETFEIKKKLNKLLDSPYFARFDFKKENNTEAKKIYIGIYNFTDSKEDSPIIYDWRAPISSVFYNYETGYVKYESPSGYISGEVLLKRQFRIKDGEMDFMLDSSINIVDDVLQKELSRSSDKGMKNIVATIQRNQNLIIRDEDSQVLIIQGVAGSGKTSIALHRIAFLLYRFKDTLSSEDILIISPNKVFGNYISNVLPELGEESVGEVQMESLAMDLLNRKYQFQTFFEQTNYLLEKDDNGLKERIKYKSSINFIKEIDKYVEYLNKKMFVARDLSVGDCFVPAWLFEEIFQDNLFYSKKDCVNEMSKIINQKILVEYKYQLESKEKKELKNAIEKMHQGKDLLRTYQALFDFIDKKNIFKFFQKNILEYCDVFPMLYLKIKLERKSIKNSNVKHLIIDEMQDYNSIQYAVISKLFNCNKTILGDINQSVNPYGSSNSDLISNIFENSKKVELNKSYRSTYEIMEFAQKISQNNKLEIIQRRGKKPELLGFKNEAEELSKIIELINEFKKSNYNTLGIILKTQKKSEKIYSYIKKMNIKSHLLTAQSNTFDQGIIICSAHMSKGLEFDQVIIPELSELNYKNLIDKNLLYVACTRAMHKLVITYSSNPSSILSFF